MEPTGDTTSPLSTSTNPIPAGWNWTTETSNLGSISSDLASASTTGNTSVDAGGTWIFSTRTSGVVVFDLDASQSARAEGRLRLEEYPDQRADRTHYVINVPEPRRQTCFGTA